MTLRTVFGLIAVFILIPTLTFAADRKMVIQVNSKDPITQKIAINNAKNLKKTIGNDGIDVELVVYGPGLSLIKSSSSTAEKVQSLISDYGVKVSVCGGTLKAYAKRHDGKEADIISGVNKVPTGALRILELQEQGYAYLRP